MKYLVILLVCIAHVQAITITEIMYNPEGSDNNKEYVEVMTTQNLENYTIADFTHNDTLKLIRWTNSAYALIVEDEFDYSEINATIYSIGSSIGNGLGNAGDSIFIYNLNGTLITSVTYDNELGYNNGKSLERDHEGWYESKRGGTPGLPNIRGKKTNISLEIVLDDTTYLGVNYTSLFKITNTKHKPNTKDEIHVTINYSINNIKRSFNATINSHKTSNTGYYAPQMVGNVTLCGTYKDQTVCKKIRTIDPKTIPCDNNVTISTQKKWFTNSEKVKFKIRTNSSLPFVVSYDITNIFNQTLKKKRNTTNTNQKVWTTRIDHPIEIAFINANLDFIACDDKNLSNNNASHMIFILKEQSQLPFVHIDKILVDKSNAATFGKRLNVEITMYNANHTNTAKLYVADSAKRVSYTSYVKPSKKYQTQTMRVPLLLKSNCNNNYGAKNYKLVFEGFTVKDEKDVFVKGQGSECKKNESIIYDLMLDPIVTNTTLNATLKITNNDKDHSFKIYSYVFRGPKSYSGYRYKNIKHIKIKKHESKNVTLINFLDIENQGTYQLKIVITKNNQTTPTVLKRDVFVIRKKAESAKIKNISFFEENESFSLFANIQAYSPESLHIQSKDGNLVVKFNETIATFKLPKNQITGHSVKQIERKPTYSNMIITALVLLLLISNRKLFKNTGSS